MRDTNNLNLPTIRANKGLSKKTTQEKKITALDLSKKTVVNKILNTKGSTIQQEIFEKNQGLDLMLVGDLTGSMTSYHTLLKNKFKELCTELFDLIQNLRIGIIFYLDHDSHLPYLTTICQPTNDIEKIYYFIESTPVANCGNSTFDEAVEDALSDLLQNIQWKEIHNRSVVLFGDASPHPVDQCPKQYDWFNLTKKLYDNNTIINSVFCGNRRYEKMQEVYLIEIGDFNNYLSYLSHAEFFSWIANVTGGMALSIENIDDLIDIIVTAAAKDAGKLDDLEAKIKKEPKKLNLIKIARKAQNRQIKAKKNRKLLE